VPGFSSSKTGMQPADGSFLRAAISISEPWRDMRGNQAGKGAKAIATLHGISR
jgi:hypothetical protein